MTRFKILPLWPFRLAIHSVFLATYQSSSLAIRIQCLCRLEAHVTSSSFTDKADNAAVGGATAVLCDTWLFTCADAKATYQFPPATAHGELFGHRSRKLQNTSANIPKNNAWTQTYYNSIMQPKTILDLPPETLCRLSSFPDDRNGRKGFLSLRITCRQICNDTMHEFVEKFLTGKLQIKGTAKQLQGLTHVLSSPHFQQILSKRVTARAQSIQNIPKRHFDKWALQKRLRNRTFAERFGYFFDEKESDYADLDKIALKDFGIVISKSVAGDMPFSGNSLSSTKDTDRLFTVMTWLESIEISACKDEDHDDLEEDGDKEERRILTKSREGIAPALLKGLTRMSPGTSHLTHLSLAEVTIPGDVLAKALAYHKGRLRKVILNKVALAGGKKRDNNWPKIFETMLGMDLLSLYIRNLFDTELHDDGAPHELLLLHLDKDEKKLVGKNWLSTIYLARKRKDRRKNNSAIWQHNREGTSFTVAYVLGGHVQKGLERILGAKHHALSLK